MTGPAAEAPIVMVAANQAWNLVNFREGLIRALLERGWRVMAVAPPAPEWQARLEAMGCTFAPLPIDAAGMNPLRDLAVLWRIVRLMRRHRPAAWLSWTIKPNTYGAIAARLCGVPAIPNVSGLGATFIRQGLVTRLAQALYGLAFRACPTVFFQNADDRDLFVSARTVQPRQVRVLPGSGIDLDAFSPPAGGRPDHPHFLMIARLLADKGVREFVAAARIVRERRPEARFSLLGPAGVANPAAIAADELAAWIDEGVVDWQGPTDDVRPAIARADWIVLPSYREGLSRVLVEASAMGRPMITTDVPGCRDVVQDGVNGLLVPARNAAALADAMLRAAAMDEQEWAGMATAARAIAVSRFSTDRIEACYLESLAAAGLVAPSRPARQ